MQHVLKNIMKFCIFAMVCTAFFSCNFFKKNFADEKKTLTIVAENNIFGCIFNDTVYEGFQYEIIKNFADSFDYQLNIILENELGTSLDKIKNGDADVLIRCLPATLPLKKKVDFTTPLYISRLVLVQQKKDKKQKNHLLAKTVSDLEAQTIYVPANSPYTKQLQYIIEDSGIDFKIEKTNIVRLERLAEMVSSGKIHYLAIDENTAKYLAKIDKNLDYQTDLGLNQFMAWAVGKSNQKLKKQLDLWLEYFLATRQYREIIRKYSL
jgi:membrane-bound lytic murein transglycosylase F